MGKKWPRFTSYSSTIVLGVLLDRGSREGIERLKIKVILV